MATPKKEEVRRNMKKWPKPSFGNNHLMLEVVAPTKGESHWQNQPHHILIISINYSHEPQPILSSLFVFTNIRSLRSFAVFENDSGPMKCESL